MSWNDLALKTGISQKLRLYSGLVISLYLVLHLLNATVGIISLSWMDAVGAVLSALWSNPFLLALLYSSIAIHVLLMFVSLAQRGSLRMPIWNLLQYATALLLPFLLIGHVVGTRGVNEVLDFHRTYTVVVWNLWQDPQGVLKQYALLLVAWMHMSMGIHYWLRFKLWYGRWIPLLYPLCLIIPLVAGIGFLVAGLESHQLAADNPLLAEARLAIRNADPESVNFLRSIESYLLWGLFVLLMVALMFQLTRKYSKWLYGGFTLTHTPTGKKFQISAEQTVLDVLREEGIQHESVCGGRGRCTTCRIRVTGYKGSLPEPVEVERKALNRIAAEPNVRLACQLKPKQNISITPLLYPGTAASVAEVTGREQQIACLFVDMRDSTRLAEARLPYDVVFIHNQFFKLLVDALNVTNGHYATFNGDGLMALYGLDSNLESGCVQALKGVVEIWQRLEQLNSWLAGELNTPLRVGIGIHCGDAIVGTMGPPDSPTVSALGDVVNISARLESLTKEYDAGLVVSEEVLANSGLDSGELVPRTVNVRGRESSLTIYTLNDVDELRGLIEAVG